VSYTFRKVYADVVTPNGTLCVVYLVWVRLLGRWFGRSGVEVYAPDGTRTVYAGDRVPTAEQATFDPTRIVFPLRGGELRLEYAPEHDAFSPPSPEACPSLTWNVLIPRGRAVLEGPGLGRVEGVGYADWVELVRPTRLLRLRELVWGRSHVGERTFAFSALALEDGRGWQNAGLWTLPARAPSPVETFAHEVDASGHARVSLGGAPLELRPERVLHAGDAFGQDRMSGRLERLVVGAIGGRTHESRWIGSATVGPAVGRAVWERVRFGGAAKRS
jgi:hypothetical protein